LKKIVIDTGVVISALLKSEGTSRKALVKAVQEFIPLLTLDTLTELERTLSKPKFSGLFSFSDKIAILELLIRQGEFVEVKTSIVACRDSSDDKFLNLAVSGEAQTILTCDPDLLVLHPFSEIAILNPRVPQSILVI
jgi:putative PIN family toxin of toxin-antitoxin system